MQLFSPTSLCSGALLWLALSSQTARAWEMQKQDATPNRTKASQKNAGSNDQERSSEKHKASAAAGEKTAVPKPETTRSQNKDDDGLSQSCPATSSKAGHLDSALLTDLGTNYTCITIRDCPRGPCTVSPQQIQVSDAALRTELKTFKPGDHLIVDISQKDNASVLQSIGVATRRIRSGNIALAIAISASALLLFASLVSWGHPLRLTIIGADNRYSNSKFQIAIWFWVLIATYLATMYFRLNEGGWDFVKINIPQNLLLLSGLSALTYAGAKGITTGKIKEAMAQQVAAGGIAKDPKCAKPGTEKFWSDLVHNDVGGFDFGDFQMIVVTLVAVGMYVILVFHFLGSLELRKAAMLPDVDTTILAAFGLGQGAYLAKKTAGDLGKA
jgi:hypothetical protein